MPSERRFSSSADQKAAFELAFAVADRLGLWVSRNAGRIQAHPEGARKKLLMPGFNAIAGSIVEEHLAKPPPTNTPPYEEDELVPSGASIS